MTGTDLVHRERTFDLTRSPSEQWNEEMLKLVAGTVLKGASTRTEQFYCLAVADSLNLNPFVEEIYFIPVKSRDGSGKVLKPYIGRNGLVAKATERGAYYQAAEVHENDVFEVETMTTGRVKLHHKFGHKDRGEIVGAYAFLHGPWKLPAFAYVELGEYLPSFDAEWKAEASPWYNQRAAMIKKCAMIVAGRERLQLGNVLADGEIDRVTQQAEAGPTRETPVKVEEFDWTALNGSVATVARLRGAVEEANQIRPDTWTPAKLALVLSGMNDLELLSQAERIEADNLHADVTPSPAGAGAAPADEPFEADAEVLPDLTDEERERVAALQVRIARLVERRDSAEDPDEVTALEEEIEHVGAELGAIGNPDQGALDV